MHKPEGFTVEMTFSDPIFTLHIMYKVKEKGIDHTDEIKVVCAKLENSSLYVVLSDYKPGLFKSLFIKLVNHNFPSLARIFLRNSEIRQVFDSLKERHIASLVSRVLYYSRESDKSGLDKDLKWTKNKPYDRIFEIVREQNGWIKKVNFSSYREPKSEYDPTYEFLFQASISLDLQFWVKGDFLTFRKNILDQMIQVVNSRFGYFSKRSESAKDRTPEPLVVQFKTPVFRDEGWNENFLDVMEELKNVSITQYHQNPYIHISLVDYQDGSSYGIWIVSETEVYIIPQIRASVASMNRIVNHINERISEGEIVKYEPVAVAEEGN